MGARFYKPLFGNKHIELRCDDNEILIYATTVGLERLITLCQGLLDRRRDGHIHLEDYDFLTHDSLKGTIALFISDAHEASLE